MRAVLLIQMQWVISGNVARSRGPHLILRGVPRLFHGWLNNYLLTIGISLANLIVLIATHDHLVISSNLLIDAVLKLILLIHVVVHLLLLDVHVVIAAARTVSSKSSTARGLALSIRIRVLTGR